MYNGKNIPVKATTIVISQQTKPNDNRDFYTKFIIYRCTKNVIPEDLLKEDTLILINPTGEFVKGGSVADAGLAGRKIICETYGGIGRHGGGAFSGKDYTKVDRIGVYYARYVAKNNITSDLAKKCEVQMAYAIGIKDAVAINIDTFGTSTLSDGDVKKIINKVFNFSPSNMKKEIINDDIKYRELATYGHIGRSDLDVP